MCLRRPFINQFEARERGERRFSTRAWGLVALLLLCVFGRPLRADSPAQWREFKVGEGYPATVTVSPRGKVWVKNGEVPSLTWFDGFDSGQVMAAESGNFRVYESRSAQLWSLYSDGIMVHERGQWTRHPVAEIRNELAANPLRRQVQQIALLPVELNRVLILLLDRLCEYNAGTRKLTVLKNAGETKLGRFAEMQEAHDGGVWISGTFGLAKLPGPARRLSAQSKWEEFLLDTPFRIENLQRPVEDAHGAVTVAGSDPDSGNRRYVARLERGRWSAVPLSGERIRQAWRDWDGQVWAFSQNSLLRLDSESPPLLAKEGGNGAHYDFATETNGVFWVASADGLFRYAPQLWRAPAEVRQIETPIHAMLSDMDGDTEVVWMAGSEGLLALRKSAVTLAKWPDDFEATFQPTDTVFKIKDGRIAISAQNRSLLFAPKTGLFESVSHPAGRQVRFIGQFKDGSLCARTARKDNPSVYHLELFDGRAFRHFLEPEVDWNLGSDISSFAAAPNGDVWIGGSLGAGHYHAGTQKMESFDSAQGLVPERVFCLADMGEGRVWCGGLDKVFELRGRRWEPVLTGVERVHCILKASDGTVWVGSNNGVFRLVNGAWVHNTTEDGLPNPAVYEVMEDAGGRVWLGTSRGPSLFHPEADPDPPRTSAAVVDTVQRSALPGATTITYGGSDKWNYTLPGRLTFSSRLDEGPWSPFTNVAFKSFQDLGGGKHHFEVRSMDRNGNRDPEGSTLEFSVIVPWFKDPRLIAVSVLGLVVTVFFAGLAVNRHLQLMRSYAAVEKIVAQRTSELEKANRELLHSQKMRALGAIAAGIAHDFNNILSIIKGSAQIIENNLEDKAKVMVRVNRIQTVVEQGAGIVRSMLGLGKVSAREFVECDVGEIAGETLKLVSDRLHPGCEAVFLGTPGIPHVVCSREILQQMLLNLLLNAIDAVQENGRIEVRVGLVPQLPAEMALEPGPAASHIVIEVADNGCGISPETLGRVFEPFYTTKAFSSRRGTGLGLSMVYELAKGMGYGLKVSSEPGQGSVFTVFIPAGGEKT